MTAAQGHGRPGGSLPVDEGDAVDGGPCEFSFRLPLVSDFSLASSGAEAAFATRQHGAVLADLARPAEGRPLETHWSCAAGPELSSNVSRVAFNPHAPGRRQLATASGRAVAIVDLAVSEARCASPSAPSSRQGSKTSAATAASGGGSGHAGAVTSCLSAHLGPVTALDWNPHKPNLLATCAEDCRFLIWDVNKPQPAQSLLSPASWTAAVRWAALSEFLLATGHEDTVCIWDLRNPSHHMSVLAPGQSRILSVDWSHHDRDKLLTVSAQQGSQVASSGSIKVWDLKSQCKVHDSIDIENGLPAAARFLPFGPAVLAAVESTVAVFLLPGGGGRRATVVKEFHGHGAPVSSVAYAPPPGGPDSGGDWRIVSVSQAERSCRGWRFRLPESLRGSLVTREGSSPPVAAPSVATLGPVPVHAAPSLTSVVPPASTPSPIRTPVLGPAASPQLSSRAPPRLAPEDVEVRLAKETRSTDETQYLGCLARQAAQLRRLSCVDEVTSFWQALPGRGIEYQLLIEVKTANDIRLRITVSVDPAAPAARAVRPTVEWADEWAGTFDGPLAPGAIEETFRALSLASLENDGNELCTCVEALDRMLLRRDGPPSLAGAAEAPQAAAPAERPPRAKGEVPLPRTCGVCWGPQGGLLCFRSLRNVKVPFPRKWSSADLRRILKIHREKELRTLLHDDNDEHTVAASRLRMDCSVHFTPTAALSGLVEDHWWTAAVTGTQSASPTAATRRQFGPPDVEAPTFLMEPSPAAPTVADVCRHNRETAMALGRRDLAEVWRLLTVLVDDSPGAAQGMRARPFAVRLVRDLMHQLFNAQETLTLAMAGVVLLCLPSPLPAEAEVQLGISSQPSRATLRRPAQRRTFDPQPPGRRPMASYTWSHSSQGMDLAAAAKSLSQGARSPGGSAGGGGGLVKTPRSADSTLSPAGLSPMQYRRTSNDSLSDGYAFGATRPPPTPCIRAAAFAEQLPEDFVPRDAPTLERLLHSAHAHCDLMHRLGRFSASRALAKLLRKLESHHELPLLSAESSFGALRRPLLASAPGVAEAGSVVREPRLPLLPEEGPSEWLAPAAGGVASAAGAGASPMGGVARDAPQCALCCLRVRTLYAPCWSCGHGFHVSCLRRWFTSRTQTCPALGCDCRCQEQCRARW